MSKNALIVDDHPIVRDALVTSLLTLEVFDDVATASSLDELKDILEGGARFDLLILDLSLMDVVGTAGMHWVRENHPDVPILIFSGNDEIDVIQEAFENGVQGFVSKNSSMPVLINAVNLVMAGSQFIPPDVIKLMGVELHEAKSATNQPETEAVRMTPKQKEVFEQLMKGAPNKIIADRLHMAEGTVKTHLHNIYQLLSVRNRAQAIIKAQQLSLID